MYPENGETAAGDPLGTAGSTDDLLDYPRSVTFLPNGTFWVGDANNDRIMQYDEIGGHGIPMTYLEENPTFVQYFNGSLFLLTPYIISYIQTWLIFLALHLILVSLLKIVGSAAPTLLCAFNAKSLCI